MPERTNEEILEDAVAMGPGPKANEQGLSVSKWASDDAQAEKVIKATRRKNPEALEREEQAKEPFGNRLFRALFAQDFKSAKDHIIWDVIIPGLKRNVYDAINDYVSYMLWGQTSPRVGGGRSDIRINRRGNYDRVSYDAYSRDNRPPWDSPNDGQGWRPRKGTVDRKASMIVDDVYFEDREDAVSVLEILDEIIDAKGYCTVLDFYKTSGVDSDYTDAKYGWRDISEAKISDTIDGFTINMPRPKAIKRSR